MHKLGIVYIDIAPPTLGDNVAWIPYVEEFRKVNNCEVLCRSKYNNLFKLAYPKIRFVDHIPQEQITHQLAFYSDKEQSWRTLPLQHQAAKQLGLPLSDIRPKIDIGPTTGFKKKYVTIGTESTMACKEWQNPTGWQDVVNHLNKLGYLVINSSLDGKKLNGCMNVDDDTPIERTAKIIKHSEFFIGLGSGLSWLAHALNKKVIMISGFSDPFCEFKEDCIRIQNPNVCHGCIHDTSLEYDRNDWLWCPRKKDFECTKQISAQMVIDAIDKVLSTKKMASNVFEDAIFKI